jgi:hypothetical protein
MMRTLPLLLCLLAACHRDTSRLSPADEQQFTAEGVTHRADNVVFRWTKGGGRTWEDRLASIVVTARTVLIHKNEKVGVRVTPTTHEHCEVHRDHDRVRISSGSGDSEETWSFTPPDDAEAWTVDIRSVMHAAPCGGGAP